MRSKSDPYRRALGLCLAAAAAAAAWQTNTLYAFPDPPLIGESGRSDTGFFFDTATTDGVYRKLSTPMREGGWSSLELDTTDPTGHTFWTVNDRGLNVAHEPSGRTDKVFPFPGYHQKIVRFRIEGSEARILSMDSIASLENASVFTVGTLSSKAATGEVALRMRLDSAVVDTTATIPPSPNGYDFESIRRRGDFLYLSDEYGPFFVKVDLATRRIVKEWYPGKGLPRVLSKRRANRGMEGMAVTPSGKLVGIIQSPMYNEVGKSTKDTRDAEMLRMVWLDPATGEVREFAYLADLKSGKRQGRDVKTSELIALSETRFLVLEQGPDTTAAKKYHVDVFEIDISPATNVTAPGADGMVVGGKTLEEIAKKPGDLAKAGIRPVAKRLLLGDVLGSTPWVSQKPEGLAVVDDSTLAMVNDNDYGMTDFGADGIPHILPSDQRALSVMYLRVPSLSARLANVSFAATGAAFRLTLLHNNDGESQLSNLGNGVVDRGGIARFKALVDTARAQAAAKGRAVLAVSAGDNFLAGKAWQATLDRDTSLPAYDGLALDRVGYDALVPGNHDFDFGPDVLSRFVRSFPDSRPPFVSGNLSFEDEPSMKALADAGRVVKGLVVEKAGEKIGIVAATTPTISYISSPRKTRIDTNVVANLQARIDSMTAAGIGKIVLVSHLQDVANDTAMAKLLHHVDVMVAGGGDDLLANCTANLQPEDTAPRAAYPIRVKDADGRIVYVVTTPGSYAYLGQLEIDFDASGEVVAVGQGSGPRRVVGGSYPDAVGEDAWIRANVLVPVESYVSNLASAKVGTSQMGLDGVRNDVRTKATNLGALVADALLWQSWQDKDAFGFDSALVSLQNGGGIRNNGILPAGDISMSDVFDVVPFGNRIAMYDKLPVAVLKDVLENAYKALPSAAGPFGQIGGATVWVDVSRTAMAVNATGALTVHGERVRQLVLDRGDTLVKDGRVVDSARAIGVATLDFMANGGDSYPFPKAGFVVAPSTQHDALRSFVQRGLGGVVDSLRYPRDFQRRVVFVQSTTGIRPGHVAGAPRLAVRGSNLLAQLDLAQAGPVELEILDLSGRRIAGVRTEMPEGLQSLELPLGGARGVLVARLRGAAGSRTQAIHVLR